MLHEDRSLLNRLRAAGLRDATALTWTAAGKILLDVYRETIEMKSARRGAKRETDSARLRAK